MSGAGNPIPPSGMWGAQNTPSWDRRSPLPRELGWAQVLLWVQLALTVLYVATVLSVVTYYSGEIFGILVYDSLPSLAGVYLARRLWQGGVWTSRPLIAVQAWIVWLSLGTLFHGDLRPTRRRRRPRRTAAARSRSGAFRTAVAAACAESLAPAQASWRPRRPAGSSSPRAARSARVTTPTMHARPSRRRSTPGPKRRRPRCGSGALRCLRTRSTGSSTAPRTPRNPVRSARRTRPTRSTRAPTSHAAKTSTAMPPRRWKARSPMPPTPTSSPRHARR